MSSWKSFYHAIGVKWTYDFLLALGIELAKKGGRIMLCTAI